MLRKFGRRFGGRRRLSGKFLLILILVLITFFLFFLIENNIKPTIESIAKSKANLTAVEIINKTIYDDVLQTTKYDNLINVQKDAQQRITLIQANSIEISRLISQTGIKIKEALTQIEKQVIEIPLGQALGSYIFAAYGPPIKVRLLPVGEVEVKLHQDFYEAGINQTRHILYLDVSVLIKVVVPLFSEEFVVNTKAPIAETIIVGDVPNTLFRLEGIDGLLKGIFYQGLN